MGSILWRSADGARFASLKRRLVAASEAAKAGVEWTLWSDEDEGPLVVALFREGLNPTEEDVTRVVTVVRGWLVDRWTVEATRHAAKRDPHARVPEHQHPKLETQEFWLSDDQAFGFLVKKDRWAIITRSRPLSVWRLREGDERGENLSLDSLDQLCVWLAENWPAIAYGNDSRPSELLIGKAAASQAYETAERKGVARKLPEIRQWWSRHSFRAAGEELPNVFAERQADDIILSWDALPTPTRFFEFLRGEVVLRAVFAVPVLRELIHSRLKLMNIAGETRSRLLAATSTGAEIGYRALALYNANVDEDWLVRHGFSNDEAREFSLAGTSRSPLVGLLRSSQNSALSTGDYEAILGLLQPAGAQSFAGLRMIADGLNSHISVREPWDSGYQLANLVRERIGRSASEQVDIDRIVQDMGVNVHEIELNDRDVRGVCVGSPMFGPIIVLNRLCDDARGVSGRRITLAHELCHLLFDRSRLRSLARFEGRRAEADRLIEMRANAFAVELLAPMSTLIGDDGTIIRDEELPAKAFERGVSVAALQEHVRNLRDRV